MESNERDRKLDQWLDEALSQYSAAEPRLGLEQRVIAQIRSEEQARAGRRSWWRWMPAFAAIAALLIVAVAVRPYWESKKEHMSTYVPAPASVKNQAPAAESRSVAKTPATSSVASTKESVPAREDSRAKEAPPLVQGRIATKDARNEERREAAVKAREQTLPASKVYRDGNEVGESLNEPTRDTDAIAADKKSVGQLQTVAPMAAASAPPEPGTGGATGGVVGGTIHGKVANSPVNAAKVAAAPGNPSRSPVQTQSEIVEVQSAAKTTEAQNGIIGTEKVVLPDVSNQLRTITLKPEGSLAKKLGEGVSGSDLGYTMLRTDLKHVPPGTVQQFPTPMPLSKEEEMMLAATKQLKGKPANEEKNDGGIPAIEIKRVEIAPLAGPPK